MKKSTAVCLFLASCFLVSAIPSAARAGVRLPSLFSDSMVLQRDRSVRVWGTADAGEHIKVTISAQSKEATAEPNGKWQVMIGPFEAGGPYVLTVAGKNTITFKNVMIGEVWICSGQSNMEFPLANAKGAAKDIAEANYPDIRLFTVRKNTSAEPLDDVQGKWEAADSKTVPQFSAVGYYFGRELYQRLKVPIGLIHTSWGGTPAEAWTSRGALASVPSLKPILDRYATDLRDLPRLEAEFQKALKQWELENTYQDPGNKGQALGYADPSHDAKDWQTMNLPRYWESTGLNIDGAVWFRTEVDVPGSWSGHDLVLSLGPVDDCDTTYFNGTRVGSIGVETPDSYSVPRRYTIPGSLVRAGANVIAVRVFDEIGFGGFGGTPDQMFLEPATAAGQSQIHLAGDWRFKVELGLSPKTPDYSKRPTAPSGPHNPNSPSVLYNAMLAPLTPYTIRGAIWYQGESNAGRAYQYRTLFPTMIRDWRSAWGEGDFPFYFVQLANYMARKDQPRDSDWAELREAQTMTLHEPHTGMAVIIDIGEANDIHPKDKLDVGLRLARWALADTYGVKIEKSGPLFESFSVAGEQIRLRFKHTDGGLKTSDGGPLKGFAIAGADRKFVWAEARVEGDSVVVWSKDVPHPVAVRYAWADNPECNLVNADGLPASPFRTDDWPGITAGNN